MLSRFKMMLIAGTVCASFMSQTRANSDEDKYELCKEFISEYKESISSQLKIEIESDFCETRSQGSVSFTTKRQLDTGIDKVDLSIQVLDKKIDCDIDKIVINNSAFTFPSTYLQGKKFYFPVGGRGCSFVETVNGAQKRTLISKRFMKYDGKILQEVIGNDLNLTSYYPNNVNVKIPYPNGGSIYTPFAFKGVGTTIYASADLAAIRGLLHLTGMAPVTIKNNGQERAIVLIIVYNFHDTGAGPYSQFQVAPLVQPDISEKIIGPFSSIDEFTDVIDHSPSKGLSKSFNGKISTWQNYVLISGYSAPHVELAIKGGRFVSYPKFLGQQQQLAEGPRLTTWVSQTKTAVGDDFEFKLTAIFPKDIDSLAFEPLFDQALGHSNLNPTTNKWNYVSAQINSKDSREFATEFEPSGILRFNGQGLLAKRLSAMKLLPLRAQISKDMIGGTWTLKRDAGPLFYDEASFMNPIPSL